jgi:ribosomal protein S27AE
MQAALHDDDENSPMNEKACARCGQVGQPATDTPGSLALEVLLWLLFLVPGLVYSVWRVSARREVCAACGSAELLPLHTPRGQALAAAAPAVTRGDYVAPSAGAVAIGRAAGRAFRWLFRRGRRG